MQGFLNNDEYWTILKGPGLSTTTPSELIPLFDIGFLQRWLICLIPSEEVKWAIKVRFWPEKPPLSLNLHFGENGHALFLCEHQIK